MKRIKKQQERERHQKQELNDPASGIKLEPATDSLLEYKYSLNKGPDMDQKMDARNGNSAISHVANQYMQQQNQFLMDGQNNIQPMQAPESNTMGSETFHQSEIKTEPMDYESSGGTSDSNGKCFTSSSVSISLYKRSFYLKHTR